MPTSRKILLQTTIPFTEDDWHIGRFSLLADHLRSLKNEKGERTWEVTLRDRNPDTTGRDPLLSSLDVSDFDQIWLFGVDDGNGLTPDDCQGITRFRKRGGGILSTRDHQDLGSSLCTLGGVGAAHYFHSVNPEPDPARHRRDDQVTTSIDYPNYHSGANGDYQKIEIMAPHVLLRRTDGSYIQHFPAHPHEGAVGAPPGDMSAHVIAAGLSLSTGHEFNLLVAFEQTADEHGNHLGRAIAESSFHHLVDYNWDIDAGCPSFVEEPPGNAIKNHPDALSDIKQYVANAAAWLGS